MSEQKTKRRPFRRFFYRGIEVQKLIDLPNAELLQMMSSRARRHFARAKGERASAQKKLVKKITEAKKRAGPTEKPDIIKTHMRNMIVVPPMIGGSVGVYNGKGYILVEIKPDMMGHYLGEFALTYQPVRHGRPGADMSTGQFVPMK